MCVKVKVIVLQIVEWGIVIVLLSRTTCKLRINDILIKYLDISGKNCNFLAATLIAHHYNTF